MAKLPKKIYGILGYPVRHSFSPAMHNAAFQAIGLGAEYKLFEKKPEEVEGFIKSLSAEGIFGLNVTIPYKEKVLSLVTLDKESFYLRQIKAINTVVREGDILKGFNTDIPGFQRHLKENIDPVNKKVALLGAGGAARAVLYVLAKSAAKEISVYDIDKNKTRDILAMIKGLFPAIIINSVDSVEQLDIKNKDLLINATPIGMKETDNCLINEDMMHRNLFVYDLIYNPSETKLLTLAKKAGAKTSNGLKMLLYQGMLSLKHWTGLEAPQDVMWQALQKELNTCRA